MKAKKIRRCKYLVECQKCYRRYETNDLRRCSCGAVQATILRGRYVNPRTGA